MYVFKVHLIITTLYIVLILNAVTIPIAYYTRNL